MSKERKCAACGMMFVVTEDTSCFSTCSGCRRPDKGSKRRKAVVFRHVNNGHGGWQEGSPGWDNAVNRIEEG